MSGSLATSPRRILGILDLCPMNRGWTTWESWTGVGSCSSSRGCTIRTLKMITFPSWREVCLLFTSFQSPSRPCGIKIRTTNRLFTTRPLRISTRLSPLSWQITCTWSYRGTPRMQHYMMTFDDKTDLKSCSVLSLQKKNKTTNKEVINESYYYYFFFLGGVFVMKITIFLIFSFY